MERGWILDGLRQSVWRCLLGLVLCSGSLASRADVPVSGGGEVDSGAAVSPAEAAQGPVAEVPRPAVDEHRYSLETVLDALRQQYAASSRQLEEREARYRASLAQARDQVARAQAKLAATEAEGRRLEAVFDDNKVELSDKAQLLTEKIGALKELFGVFQQNASDLIGAFNGSATSLQFPDRDVWLEGFANRMKNASEVSSADDIKALWYEVLREIGALGRVVRLRAPVVDLSGAATEQELVRIGGFGLISAAPAPGYLQWDVGYQRAVRMARQPVGPYAAELGAYLGADDGLHSLSVDPTGGVLLSLLAEKPTTGERADQGGLVGYMIIALGLSAFVLAVLKLLDISLISLRVAAQQRCLGQPRQDNALGRLLLVYRQNRAADAETLGMLLHDRVAKESGRIRRFTIFLAIIAAVAPLLGLLGTVVGMINTFQAITLYGTGDPQTMAGGISQALITTVLGLIVAVPAVLLNALLGARAKAVIQVLNRQMALLLGDSLALRDSRKLSADHPAEPGFGPAPQPA